MDFLHELERSGHLKQVPSSKVAVTPVFGRDAFNNEYTHRVSIAINLETAHQLHALLQVAKQIRNVFEAFPRRGVAR